MVKIKTITNEMWDELYCKPFVFLGFHEHDNKLSAIAIFDDGMSEYRVMDNCHSSRQEFFENVKKKYIGSPIAVLNQKTKKFLMEILSEKSGKQSFMKINLKGPKTCLSRWGDEIESSFKFGKKNISQDNPIQLF